MVVVFGSNFDLFSIIFDAFVFIIATILAYFIAKWAKNKRFKSRVATTFGNLDPKTGLCMMRDIPGYNERPASVRWEDEKGRINRRNTDGYPTLQMDFATTHGGGIERIYVCASNSRTCQNTEALCGQWMENDLSNLADHTVSLWDEQNAILDVEPPTFKQVWWQIVLGVFAGMAVGVIVLTFWLSRQTPPPTNSTATHAPIMDAVNMIRIAVGR